jgi:hypothetical protein
VCNVIVAAVAVLLLMRAGATLLIDAWSRRRRWLSLVERLRPFQPSVADEAEVWLRRQ